MQSSTYMLADVGDATLLRDLATLVARDCVTTAELLAHLAEVDARRLYLPAGYPSMYEYCIRDLGLSEDAAYKRIRAARTARRVPALFDALAGGRLHLSVIVFLAPYVTPENAGELIAAVERKTRPEIELLLARRFPQSGLLPMIEAGISASLPRSPSPAAQLATWPVEVSTGGADGGRPRGRARPLAPGCYALHLSISQMGHDRLEYARSLLSHEIPSGDLAEVLERVLDIAVSVLEKRKFAATRRPRLSRARDARHGKTFAGRPATAKRAARPMTTELPGDSGNAAACPTTMEPCAGTVKSEAENDGASAATGVAEAGARAGRLPGTAMPDVMGSRQITRSKHERPRRAVPAHVKRAVWARDQGACTFVGPGGRRCRARDFLEFDHVDPVARGGSATMDNIRLRCRAHNRLEAERIFGEAFMRGKREAATTGSGSRGVLHPGTRDVMACMRALGYRVEEARRAALYSEEDMGAPIEERVRVALSIFSPRGTTTPGPAGAQPTRGVNRGGPTESGT